ncbi:pilus assembly protein TadG-related protein [Hyphococcus sp.]|uniref:pilus assembly protein TadG-related protein n=1 Tax=Hyphococcus sp. TaxID=2038636 RepID=UPI003CCBD62F
MFVTDKTGSIALLFAMFLPIAILCLGLGVDLMLLFTERRKAQGAADIAAIVAAQSSQNPESAAREILSINGYDVISSIEMGRLDEDEKAKAITTKTEFEVIAGRYAPDPDINYKKRFSPGHTPYNAARVNVKKKAKFYFLDKIIDAPRISINATASRRALAAFSVGSRLAAVDDGLLNELLGALTGTQISLSVLDYESLIKAEIEVFGFINALASQMDIEAGAYDDVLKSDPTFSDIAAALLEINGEGHVYSALLALSSHFDSAAGSVDLEKVFDLGPAGAISLGDPVGPGFPAYARLFDVVLANAVVADGNRLIEVDLAASAPGLASLTAAIEIAEPMQSSPWFSLGEAGQTISNVQARIFVEASVGGTGLLSGTTVRLPFYMELARAHGALSTVECPGGRIENITVRLKASSSIVDAWIADVDVSPGYIGDSIKEAHLVSAPGLSVIGQAHAGTETPTPEILQYSWIDIANGTVKTTRTNGAADLLIENLIEALELEVSALGLGLGSGAFQKTALNEALSVLAGPIDGVVDQLLGALGISLGEGDFRVNGAKCDHAVLVQ